MSTNYYLRNEKTGEMDHVGQFAARRFTFRSHRSGTTFFPVTFEQVEEKLRSSKHKLVSEYGVEEDVDEFLRWVKTTEKKPLPVNYQTEPSTHDPQFFDPNHWRFLACEFC